MQQGATDDLGDATPTIYVEISTQLRHYLLNLNIYNLHSIYLSTLARYLHSGCTYRICHTGNPAITKCFLEDLDNFKILNILKTMDLPTHHLTIPLSFAKPYILKRF